MGCCQTQKELKRPGDPDFTGYGDYKWESKQSYDGVWLNGQPHGKGTINFANGSQYIGPFKHGLGHGYGEMTEKKSDGSIRWKYKGNFINGRRSGWGSLTIRSTNKYVGNFLNGMAHGRGSYFYLISGNVLEGDYFKGVARGDCKMTFKSGSVFEGTILQNLTRKLDSYS